jgi:hypothetical protein
MHPIRGGDGEYAIGREPRAVEPSAGGAGARGDEGDEEEWVVVAANGSKAASFPGTSPHSSSRGHPRAVLFWRNPARRFMSYLLIRVDCFN